MNYITPPDDLFSNINAKNERVIEGGAFFEFDKVEYPPEGGILMYFKGCMFPRKGFPFPEAMWSVNGVKSTLRLFLRLVAPYKLLFKKSRNNIIGDLAHQFVKFSDRVGLKEQYLCLTAKEAKFFTYSFFKKLEMPDHVCNIFSDVVSLILEYDDAYRYRLQDIMTMTTQEDLTKKPISELNRLLAIMKERDSAEVYGKTSMVVKLMVLLLLIPKIRKIFKEIVNNIDITKLQFDTADQYWILCKGGGYNYLGKPIEERLAIFSMLHGDKMPQQYYQE